MITTAYINLWNRQVGAIAWNPETGIASFEYNPDFLKTNLDLAPLTMPIQEASGKIFSFPELRDHNTFKGLPGLLADMLPDRYGNTLIKTWLSNLGRPPGSINPVETLCFIGNRSIGALEVEPVIFHTSTRTSKIELDSLVEMAGNILTDRKNFSTNLDEDEQKALQDIIKIGTSAGGARAKAVIAWNSATGEIRSGQTAVPKGFSHWLIKFDGVIDNQSGVTSGYGRIEMAYHLMALDAGIEMAECRLLEENGRAHFMTKRFDRDPEQGKIHMQSLCAIRHFDFNDVGYYSYEHIFETMRMLGLPYPQAEQLYRRMVFNVLGQNCDDHTKNFAFLMDRTGKWRLSPAFDICYAYRPGSEWVSQHSLSIHGKRKNITKTDLLEVARQMNIKNAENSIRQVAEVLSHWENYADKVKVDPQKKKAIADSLILLK
jgi:serine/threonine-protein kinase HipA